MVHNLTMTMIWGLEIFLRLLPPRLDRAIPGIPVKMHFYIDTDSGLSVNVKKKRSETNTRLISTNKRLILIKTVLFLTCLDGRWFSNVDTVQLFQLTFRTGKIKCSGPEGF